MVNLGDLVYNIIANDQASGKTAEVAKNVGAAAVTIGAGITAAGTAATLLIDSNRKMDAAFETTALSMGTSTDVVKEMARSLQSVDSPIEEVSRTLDSLARAGMDNIDQLKGTASAFDTLADATGKDAGVLTDALIPAFNALGIPLEKAPEQVDGLATMFRTSNVDLADFSALMTKIGPDLGTMGLGLTDVEAILMSFADKGIKGRKATTMLSGAIKDANGDTAALYKSLGITSDELATYKTKVEESAGAAQKFADAQNKQFGTMDKIAFKVTELKQKAGDMLAPFEGVAAAAMGLGPALAGLGGIIASVAGAGGMGAITASATALIVPLAAVAGVVTLVVGGFYGMYTQSEKFRAMIGSIIDGAVSLGKAFIVWVTPIKDAIIAALLPALKQMGDFFAGQFAKITTWLGGDGKSFLAFLGTVASTLQGAILEGIKQFGKVWDQYLKPAFEWFVGGVIDDVLRGLKNLGDWFANPATQSGIKTIAGALAAFAAIITGTVIPAAVWMYTELTRIWTDICGVLGGKTGAATDLAGTLKEVWDAICKYVPIGWDLIKNAVVTAAGLIWTWLSTEGLRLAGVAAGSIWTAICVGVPLAWGFIQTAVITAAGLIWTWLSTEGLRLAGVAVAAIWTGICVGVPLAWDLIKTAVVTAAQLIWNWLTTDAPPLAITAAGFIWSGIQGGVAGAWAGILTAVYNEAHKIVDQIDKVKSDVVAAAQRVWDAAQNVFDIPHVVTNVVETVTNYVTGQASTTVPGQQPVSTGDTVYDPALGQYVPTGSIISHHTGGVYEAPGGGREGLALLLSGERVLSPAQTSEYDSGLLSAVRELTSMIQSGLGAGKQEIVLQFRADVPGMIQRIDDHNADRNASLGYRCVI